MQIILDELSIANPNATAVTAGVAGRLAPDGSIIVCAAGDTPDGIIKYTTDGGVTLMFDGVIPGTAGGVIVPGGEVKVGANGNFVATSPGDVPCGKFIGLANCANGDTIQIEWYRRGRNNVTASGTAALVAGTVTVNTTAVAANSIVKLYRQAAGGTLGHLSVGAIVAATSFVINSSSNIDTSTIFWEVVN
jgi:hypothetical protein